MWTLNFIKEADLIAHIQATIEKYGEKLQPFDLQRFNKNTVDPIKLVFDKTVYRFSWEDIITHEIFRQRDKSNNNDIGYFHQRIFKYIKNCSVPDNGEDGGWDVIYKNPKGIQLPDGSKVSKIYVEMKNKHNTMNAASSAKTFIKMQNQLLEDDDCACFLVEVIAQKSQNIKWETSVDKKRVGHKLIRRVSIDQFYSLVTEQEDAFYQLCMQLPALIEKAVNAMPSSTQPKDTVFNEIFALAKENKQSSKELAIILAFYTLGFKDYLGFDSDA
ncbi:Eco47II family restriction endonuclease [Pelistega suis]|uniref:Eco47II family restriction endonuclease n=1 Tax=Pelistega suis TaxID=1631957 RepID=A0A849P3L3_9BURK|nr:Eco47II family restriction endonuclease [Pelistega suis]NOL51231.1 Eco47II family restriction endonuclease [Pelistega suis]